MSDTDVAWFRRNRDANLRLRRPGEGEVEELARRFGAGAYHDLAMAGGKLPPPTLDVEWQIAVIRADQSTIIRLLTLRKVDEPDAPAPEFSCFAVAAFNRVAIDRR